MEASRLHGHSEPNVIAHVRNVRGRAPLSRLSEVHSVAQASDNVREAAAFARRVACRALVVVGGAVAGTALAWVLSSTSASAESVGDDPARGPEVQVVTELVTPVSGALGEVADRLPHPPPPSDDPLKELGDRVREAADHFGERAAEGFEQLPTCDMSGCELGLEDIGAVGEIDAPGSYLPDDGFGRSDLPQTLPAVAPVSGATPDFLAESTATGRANADGMNRRGSPAQDLRSLPALPDFPAWPAPFAPAAPTTPAPGGQGHAGNHVDGALSAALPWLDGFTALTAGQTLPATEVISFGRAGAQPGVTPD